MTATKPVIERFLGKDTTLWLKSGKKVQIGNALVITDKEETHVCIGEISGDNKSFTLNVQKVMPFKTRQLERVTYRNKDTGNFETFRF